MKKIILTTLIVILSLSFVYSAYAEEVSYKRLQIDLMSQDPDPVEPNKYVDLRFKIYSTGETVRDVTIELLPEYPFSIDPNEKAERIVGTINGYSTEDGATIVKYKVRVAKDAIEGTEEIKLRYKTSQGVWVTEKYEIEIQTVDATISVMGVETIPEKIEPGKTATVKITVKNMADSIMNDVSLKLDLALSTTQIPVTSSEVSLYDSIPLAPISSSTEKKVDYIKSGESATFVYEVIAYPDADPGVYKIPIQMNYYDELDTQITKNDIIGLVIGSEPEMSIIIDNHELYKGQTRGEVIVKFVNKGTAEVRFLDVYLRATEQYEILTPDNVYVGMIGSDDYETAEFKLYLGENEYDEIKLPLYIEYKDQNNEQHKENHELTIKLFTQEQLETAQSSSTGMIIGGILVVLIIWFIYRKIRKKKQ